MFVIVPLWVALIIFVVGLAFALLRIFSTPFMPLIRPWIYFIFYALFAWGAAWGIKWLTGLDLTFVLIFSAFIMTIFMRVDEDDFNGQNILIPLYLFLFYTSLKQLGLDIISDFPKNSQQFKDFMLFMPELKSFDDYQKLVAVVMSFIGLCTFFPRARFPYLPRDYFAFILYIGLFGYFITQFFEPFGKDITTTLEIWLFYIFTGLSALVAFAGIIYAIVCIFKDNKLKIAAYTDEYGGISICEDAEKSQQREAGGAFLAMLLLVLYIISKFTFHYIG